MTGYLLVSGVVTELGAEAVLEAKLEEEGTEKILGIRGVEGATELERRMLELREVTLEVILLDIALLDTFVKIALLESVLLIIEPVLLVLEIGRLLEADSEDELAGIELDSTI